MRNVLNVDGCFLLDSLGKLENDREKEMKLSVDLLYTCYTPYGPVSCITTKAKRGVLQSAVHQYGLHTPAISFKKSQRSI